MLTVTTQSGTSYELDDTTMTVRRVAKIDVYCPPECQPEVTQVWPNDTWLPYEHHELLPAPHPFQGEQLAIRGLPDSIPGGWVLTSVVTSVEDDPFRVRLHHGVALAD